MWKIELGEGDTELKVNDKQVKKKIGNKENWYKN